MPEDKYCDCGAKMYYAEKQINGCRTCGKYWDQYASEDSKCTEEGHNKFSKVTKGYYCRNCDGEP